MNEELIIFWNKIRAWAEPYIAQIESYIAEIRAWAEPYMAWAEPYIAWAEPYLAQAEPYIAELEALIARTGWQEYHHAIGIALVILGILLILSLFLRIRRHYRPQQTDMMAGLTLQHVEEADETTRALHQIESDMRALKELFDAKRIDSRVYVSESKNLYKSAKNIYENKGE